MDGGSQDARVVFLVPYRSNGRERDLLWNWCRKWWTVGVPEFPVVVGSSPEGPFNRSAAINDAARKAEPWDVAVVLDADVVTASPWQARVAVEAALMTREVILGFTNYHALTPAWTRAVLEGNAEPSARGRLTTRRNHESSVVVIPRSAWETIGGFDEEFVGWGQEDVAFAQSARVLVGLRRVPGDVFHLFHTRTKERRKSLPEYRANQARGRAYRQANDPEGIRAARGGV